MSGSSMHVTGPPVTPTVRPSARLLLRSPRPRCMRPSVLAGWGSEERHGVVRDLADRGVEGGDAVLGQLLTHDAAHLLAGPRTDASSVPTPVSRGPQRHARRLGRR
jgi:hypothetical protein